MIVGMNHFTVIAEDERKTLEFYVDLLGLTVGYRPDPGFPGAWLYAGGPQAVLHMYFDRPVPAQRVGVIDHMAFTARDLRAVKVRFDRSGTKYGFCRNSGVRRSEGRGHARVKRPGNRTALPPTRLWLWDDQVALS